MDLDGCKSYLKEQINRYKKYEKEDLIDHNTEAAYRAKLVAGAYEDALNMLNKVDE